MSDAKLDIIVTHYNEPWELGEKLFTILRLQRGVDFDDFRVLIVHDGTDDFPREYFKNMPYRVDQVIIPHAGIAAARNEGIRSATAPWIMFCDFDDTFSNIYALRDYLGLLPNDDLNMMWAPFIAEDRTKDGQFILNLRGQNLVFVHGKMYRRQYLLEEQLWFPEDLEFNEDSAFNAILNTICDPKKIGEIKAPMTPYVWAFNPRSLTTTPGNRYKAMIGLYWRNRKVVDVFKARMPHDRFCAMVARACVDAYYILNLSEIPEELKPIREDFVGFYHENKEAMWETPADLLRQIKAISRAEHETGDREEEQRLGELALNIPHADRTVTQWLDMIWKEGETT